jgi:hypothetical protein
MSKFMIKLKGWVLGLGTGLALVLGAGAASASVTPAEPVAIKAEFSSGVAGPYFTVVRAMDVADYLEDLGFYTSVDYRSGYWWVTYW